ncbi:MAG: glycosyltransferase [Phycisphaerales bacterium]|nr:glycosyltransferase [Phycisphaerales bacterium]
MRVFMLGWEFPPFISGGLGTACFGLTRAMDKLGTQVIFILPHAVSDASASHVALRSPAGLSEDELAEIEEGEEMQPPAEAGFRHIRFRRVAAMLDPYARPAGTPDAEIALAAAGAAGAAARAGAEARAVPPIAPPVSGGSKPGVSAGGHYAGDLFAEAERYARAAVRLARRESFDVVHAHDWMTFPAGIAVAQDSGRPLVVHVHSTEFDRSGTHVNQRIYDIERAGMHAATRVIAVSHLTRTIVEHRYGVAGAKVEVVYNAIDDDNNGRPAREAAPIRSDEKIVLFMGRITMQKGPEFFLAAAKRVLEVEQNVRFIMAGSGDMAKRMIELAESMGIGDRVTFTGFLRGADVHRVFQMADLYVMPSVSEPFGIAPLEALSNDVPVLISKQSGVAEILTHALKVDFWDVDEMANKIVAVLRHPPLRNTLREHGSFEIRQLSWTDSAARCLEVYSAAVAAFVRR